MGDSRWFVSHSLRPKARLHFFCLPYAGGGAAIFRTWPQGLPADLNVLAIELPGRASRFRDSPMTQLLPIVRVLATELMSILDRPFVLFGHSMGGLLAFEIARELRRRGAPLPLHLFISAHTSPERSRRISLAHKFPDAEFIDYLRKLGGTPPEVLANPDIMQILLPMLRADWSVLETYEHVVEPPLDVPITVLGGLGDPLTSQQDLAAWSNQTRSSFALRMLPGSHFFLRTAESLVLRTILQELRMTLGD